MIVIDIETTGLEKEKHAIASIGAVDFEKPNRQFYGECKIPHYAQITDFAVKWNGFNEESLRDPKKQDVKTLLTNLVDWISGTEDQTFAGENIRWDRDFIQYNLDMYGIAYQTGHRTCDLHSESYSYRKRRGMVIPLNKNLSALNMDETFKFVGLPQEPMPHNGLTGAKMEAEAFSRFWYKKNLLTEFSTYPVPNYL